MCPYLSSLDVIEVTVNDTLLITGNWYRFTSYVGGEVPTSCPNLDTCGTNNPIWLDGQHPTGTSN